jgi:arginine/glutamate-rich protein 1
VKLDVERRIEEGIRKLFDEVDSQLQKEKEAALHEARQKAVSSMYLYAFCS